MPYEAPTHEELYQRIKTLLTERGSTVGRIDLQGLADAHRVSTTPVREVLCRLMGERLVERHASGGFALAAMDAPHLRDLYAWHGHHLLAALHLLPSAMVLRILARLEPEVARHPERESLLLYLDFERAIADGTGIAEFGRALEASAERLRRAREAERSVFADGAREMRSMLKTDVSDVKNNVRRRIAAYHRRRIDHAGQIASLIVEAP